jgi:hypothetical protein
MRPFLSWQRDHKPGELPIERWRFQTVFPLYFTHVSLSLFHRWEGHGPVINRPLAGFLRRYQLSLGYTPGLVLLACVILALLAGLGVGRARRSGQRLACLLWLAVGLGLLLSAAVYQFSWRYQLPALVTIPPAAALALSALTSPRESSAAREPTRLDDAASAVPDDRSASRPHRRVEPMEGTARVREPARPSEAQHHVHADNPRDPGGHPGMHGPAPGLASALPCHDQPDTPRPEPGHSSRRRPGRRRR